MTTFIHITDKRNEQKIKRNGIKGNVYCFPVLQDFQLTHNWGRELKRFRGNNSLVCVQFSVPDNELVSVGMQGKPDSQTLSASKAYELIMKHDDPRGFEVILPRKVYASEIKRIYDAPRIAGWRYFPKSKGVEPGYGKYANKGEIKAQRLIKKYDGFVRLTKAGNNSKLRNEEQYTD